MFSNYDRNPFYYMIEYVFYVGWAVIMATLAVLLVKVCSEVISLIFFSRSLLHTPVVLEFPKSNASSPVS